MESYKKVGMVSKVIKFPGKKKMTAEYQPYKKHVAITFYIRNVVGVNEDDWDRKVREIAITAVSGMDDNLDFYDFEYSEADLSEA